MRDLRKNLGQYIALRQALGYKLRKHKPWPNEFLAFLEAKSADHITTKLAIAWETESSSGHKHSCFERLSFVRSFAIHMSSLALHPTTVESLIRYKARRDAFLKKADAPTFFINERRGPISSPHKSFRDIRCAAGLEKTRDGTRPRMHELRHTFAVQTLLGWYRNGADVERNLPILSTFLGHSQVEKYLLVSIIYARVAGGRM